MSSCKSSVVAASISSRSLCSTVVAPLIPRQYINGLTSFFPLVYLLCSSPCQGFVCRVPEICYPLFLTEALNISFHSFHLVTFRVFINKIDLRTAYNGPFGTVGDLGNMFGSRKSEAN